MKADARFEAFPEMPARSLSTKDILVEAIRYLTLSSHARLHQLAALRELDERLLADIGITRHEAKLGRRSIAGDCSCRAALGAGTSVRNAEQAVVRARRGDEVVVRNATESDMAAIHSIYVRHVRHGLATFEEVPPPVDELMSRRATVLSLGLPYLVAELDGRVAGYCYATAYRPRSAYRYTIEDSVYVAEGFDGRGIGTALLETLIARCEAVPWRQMLAVNGSSDNAGSIALHRRLGFEPAGTLKSVGFKLGRWVDTVLMQRSLGPGDAAPPKSAIERKPAP